MRYRRVSTIPVLKVILPPDILIVVVVCNEAGIATRGASEFEIVIDDSPLATPTIPIPKNIVCLF